jgi:hypothetical protein
MENWADLPLLRFGFNDPNPYLHLCRHRTKLWRSNLLRYGEARIHDNVIYPIALSDRASI